jgi:hypothetical protein
VYHPQAADSPAGDVYSEYLAGDGGLGADTQTFLFSLWFKPRTVDGNPRSLITPESIASGVSIHYDNGGLYVRAIDSVTTADMANESNFAPSVGVWNYAMVSLNFTATPDRRLQLLFNGTAFNTPVSDNGINGAYRSGTQQNVGKAQASLGSFNFFGCITEVWGDAVDAAITPTIVNKFLDGSAPRFLGTDGSLPFGAQPRLYQTGDGASFAVNKGTQIATTGGGAPVWTDCTDGP